MGRPRQMPLWFAGAVKACPTAASGMNSKTTSEQATSFGTEPPGNQASKGNTATQCGGCSEFGVRSVKCQAAKSCMSFQVRSRRSCEIQVTLYSNESFAVESPIGTPRNYKSDAGVGGWHPSCCSCLEVKTMLRCLRCEYQNSPGHRFCGMCGDPLATAEPGRTDSTSSSLPPRANSVVGPSFLGLAEPESGGYLLEDEPRRGHGLLYLVLAVLLVTGAIFAWRWQASGYAWRAVMASHRLLGDEAHRTENSVSPAAPEGEKAPESSASVTSIKPGDEGQQLSPDHLSNLGSASRPQIDSPTADTTAATQVSRLEPSNAASIERQETSPSPQRGQRLVAEGKSYLYGTGVRANCAHARTSLFMAAEEDNPDAQSILGTMFATGHCVSVDLPTAYHWLSRALRQDRNSSYIISTRRVVWNEMTSEQQQAAVHDAQ